MTVYIHVHRGRTNDANPIAAGVVCFAPDGSVLLLKRAPDEKNYGGYWGLPGGGADQGETPEAAARREVKEETGYTITGELSLVDAQVTPNNWTFYTYVWFGPKFKPKLDHEHTVYKWAPRDALPSPLHPSVAVTLSDLP